MNLEPTGTSRSEMIVSVMVWRGFWQLIFMGFYVFVNPMKFGAFDRNPLKSAHSRALRRPRAGMCPKITGSAETTLMHGVFNVFWIVIWDRILLFYVIL